MHMASNRNWVVKMPTHPTSNEERRLLLRDDDDTNERASRKGGSGSRHFLLCIFGIVFCVVIPATSVFMLSRVLGAEIRDRIDPIVRRTTPIINDAQVVMHSASQMAQLLETTMNHTARNPVTPNAFMNIAETINASKRLISNLATLTNRPTMTINVG